MSNHLWTQQEDQLLTELVTSNTKWKQISAVIKRSIRGCTKRWNKINPCFKTDGWGKQEDADLIQWVFSDLEERVTPQHSLWQHRRRVDVLKRLEFMKKQLFDKMFPQGFTSCTKNETLQDTAKQSAKSKAKAGVKRKVKEEQKIYDEYSDQESEHQSFDSSLKNKKTSSIKEEFKCDIRQDWNKPESDWQSINQKSLSRDQFYILSGIDEPGTPWSKTEDEQLFELVGGLKDDWDSMSKFIQNRSADCIHNHYVNTLKWAAQQYKNDCDFKLNKLSKMFDNCKFYIQNPVSEDEEVLKPLHSVAAYLLGISLSVKPEFTVNHENDRLDEKERMREVFKRKVQEGKSSSLLTISNKFSNPFIHQGNEDKNVNQSKFKFISGLCSEDSDSKLSNDSNSSGLDLLLNI